MARYHKVFLLGSGSYGKAWVVEDQKEHKRQMVLKEINLKTLSERDVEQALTEVAVLSRCIHENIIGYNEAFVNKSSMRLSIVMDYAAGGDLHKKIKDRRGLYFPNEIVLKWFSQLVSALCYIHDKAILHRDIKPQNMFLSEQQNLKLGDFGISRILNSHTDVAFTIIGTPFYLSPEICRQQPYSYKSDMWAAGCVLYELCCLCVPFTATNLPSLTTQIQNGVYSPLPSHCGNLLTDIVSSLLNSDPDHRPTADDLLQMPELQQVLKPDQLRNGMFLFPRERGRREQPHRAGDQEKVDKKSDRKSPTQQKKNLSQQNKSRGVDNTTYTVIRHPKVRRLSLASPELTAMIENQRSQSLERQRAVSVDAQKSNKTKNKNLSPRLNILQQMKDVTVDDDEKENLLPRNKSDFEDKVYYNDTDDIFTEALYNCFISKSSSEEVAEVVLDYLKMTVGKNEAVEAICQVRAKPEYNCLVKMGCLTPSSIQAILLYLTLTEGRR